MSLTTSQRERLRKDPRFSRSVHGSLSGVLGRGWTLPISAARLPLKVAYRTAMLAAVVTATHAQGTPVLS